MHQEKHLAEILLDYGLSVGGKDIGMVPGLQEATIDEHWGIKCNGHDYDIEGMPPYTWKIEYNGSPWGIVDVFDGEGVIRRGETGNIESIISAIEAKTKK